MRRYKWNIEKIKAAKLRYCSGESMESIARDFQVSATNVAQVLKEEGVWKTKKPKPLTDRKWVSLGKKYRSGITVKSIAEELGRCRDWLGKNLKKKFGSRKKVWAGKRKYAVQEGYFDVINTEKKAYWLGFLAADGTISLSEQRGVVSLGLQRKDKQHLQKFRHTIRSNHRIYQTIKKTKNKAYVGWRRTDPISIRN